jgi:hypothetical protein
MNQPQLAQDIQQLKHDVHQQQQQNTQIVQNLAQINQTLVQISLTLQNMYVLLHCGHDSQMPGSSPVPRELLPMRSYNATALMDKPLLYPPAVAVVHPLPKTKK